VSGSITLHAQGDTAVVTYDGETDCDPDQNAHLSVNGKDRGFVSGINCAMRNGTRGSSSFPAGLLALTLLLAHSRRRLRGD
jgi:MYXO-CTERM domain-containing protein